MSLPRRARDLIATAGDGDGPTAAERARLRARVLARVGAAAAVGTAGVALSVKAAPTIAAVADAGVGGAAGVAKSSLAALVTKLLSVVMIVGLGATGYVVLSGEARAPLAVAPLPATAASLKALARSQPFPPTPEVPPAQAGVVDESPVAPTTQPASGAAARGPGAATVAAAREVRPNVVAASAAPPARVEPPAAPESVEEETASLAAVLAALHDRRAQEALSALDAQDARYAGGSLREERAATRIDALCMLHRTDAARAGVARFLSDHPHSLLAPHVGASCGAVALP